MLMPVSASDSVVSMAASGDVEKGDKDCGRDIADHKSTIHKHDSDDTRFCLILRLFERF